VRERIEYRFRVLSAAVFTLYSYSKALEYRFRVPTTGSLMHEDAHTALEMTSKEADATSSDEGTAGRRDKRGRGNQGTWELG
jgi:hypothetical protein